MQKVKILRIEGKNDRQFVYIKQGGVIKKYILEGFRGKFEIESWIPPLKVKPRIRILGS